MGRAPKAAQPRPATDTAAEERSRLKKLALSKKILSDTASKSQVQLGPSKTVLKHHGKDIIKKSQRKNRYLFSFPGLVAPISGGKIGELKDLGTKNPILYLDFPQGQMKLFGTIVYPKNRYLTLHFSRGGKNVMCEDYFENMIVFSDAWWIGRQEDNPEEAHLDFPKEMIQEQQSEYDFQGGAGGMFVDKPAVNRTERKYPEEDSPEPELKHDASDDEEKLDEPMELTPVRHSERNARKTYRYREASSEDDPDLSDVASDEKETEDGSSADGTDEGELKTVVQSNDQPTSSVTKSKETSQSKKGSLVQTSISTLFKKAAEEKVQTKLKKSTAKKGSGKKQENTDSKRKIDQVEDDDDDDEDAIEPFTISSEDTDGSDEEWAA